MGITTESSGSRKAKQKLFSQAGTIAVKTAKNAGLPITYVENNSVVREHANGQKEILASVPCNRVLPQKKFNIK